MNRRSAIARMLVGVLVLATACIAQADEDPAAYPSKTIRIIVPYAAGGGTDLLARTWADVLSKQFNQAVIVENKAGGNGIIGTSYAARSAPDGYTIYIATYGFPVTPLLVKDAQYAVSDFAPIIRTGFGPLALVVAANSPIKDMQDLVAMARAKPGALNAATLGDGSQEQMGTVKFQTSARVKFTEVPYKGGAPAIQDIMAGNIQLMFEGLPTVMGFIKGGTIRVLAVTGAVRSSQLPNVPTIDELGFKDVEVYSWTGFLVPAKTPRPIVDKLNAAFRKGLADPAVVGKIAETFGSDPAGGSAEDFQAFLAARIKENAELIKALNIKPQ